MGYKFGVLLYPIYYLLLISLYIYYLPLYPIHIHCYGYTI